MKLLMTLIYMALPCLNSYTFVGCALSLSFFFSSRLWAPWVFHNGCVPSLGLSDFGVIDFPSLSLNKEFPCIDVMFIGT